MIGTIVLFAVLATQVYSIVRSETLLRRERNLHKQIEDYLTRLTPAGLWLQYETLKKFYEEALGELAKTTQALEEAQLRVTNQNETHLLLMRSYKQTSNILSRMLDRLIEGQQQLASISPSASTSPSSSPSPSV
jgi:hypothetical protein